MAKFGDSGKGMSEFEKMMCEMMVRRFTEDGHSLPVIGIDIEINPIGVSARVKGNGSVIKDFGIEKEFEEFQQEITPIMEKYSKIVADKYKQNFENFKTDLASGGGTADHKPDAAEIMEMLDALKELFK